MSLSITSANLKSGCSSHRQVVVDDEGVSRTFEVTLPQVDALIDELGGSQQAKRMLILLWAAYRRSQGRAITGVTIA